MPVSNAGSIEVATAQLSGKFCCPNQLSFMFLCLKRLRRSGNWAVILRCWLPKMFIWRGMRTVQRRVRTWSWWFCNDLSTIFCFALHTSIWREQSTLEYVRECSLVASYISLGGLAKTISPYRRWLCLSPLSGAAEGGWVEEVTGLMRSKHALFREFKRLNHTRLVVQTGYSFVCCNIWVNRNRRQIISCLCAIWANKNDLWYHRVQNIVEYKPLVLLEWRLLEPITKVEFFHFDRATSLDASLENVAFLYTWAID